MNFTSLHRALGLEPSPLMYSMMEQAVSDEVTERSDLDWKRDLPQSRGEESREEFAKDVAAMANSGGGTIVYGIEEDRQTSAAKAVVGVSGWEDRTQRTLRTWAFNSINPSVHGLEFTPVQRGPKTVVVLTVPASAETPHLTVKNGGTFRAPRRDGTATVYMTEREIESHYRLRFEDRHRRDKSLDEVIGQISQGIPSDGRVWFIAAARPERARPASMGRLAKEEVRDIIARVMNQNPFMKPNMGVQGLEDASLNPRPRLRRWRSVGPDANRLNVIVEVHDDGFLALAVAAELDGELDHGDVHVMDAEKFPAHLVQLVRAASEQLSLTTDYALRLVILTKPQQDVFIRSLATGMNALEDRAQSNRVALIEPVEGLVRAGATEDELLEEARNLALDIVNLAGHMNLTTLYLKSSTG